MNIFVMFSTQKTGLFPSRLTGHTVTLQKLSSSLLSASLLWVSVSPAHLLVQTHFFQLSHHSSSCSLASCKKVIFGVFFFFPVPKNEFILLFHHIHPGLIIHTTSPGIMKPPRSQINPWEIWGKSHYLEYLPFKWGKHHKMHTFWNMR